MREPLHRLSAVKLAQLITAGAASPETVTRSFIDAIHERERDVLTADLGVTEGDGLLLRLLQGLLRLLREFLHVHGLPPRGCSDGCAPHGPR